MIDLVKILQNSEHFCDLNHYAVYARTEKPRRLLNKAKLLFGEAH